MERYVKRGVEIKFSVGVKIDIFTDGNTLEVYGKSIEEVEVSAVRTLYRCR